MSASMQIAVLTRHNVATSIIDGRVHALTEGTQTFKGSDGCMHTTPLDWWVDMTNFTMRDIMTWLGY